MMNQPLPHIPEALMELLHRATEQFHERKIDLEKAMDGSEYRHQERIDAAQASLHQAERAVEEVEQQIKKLLSSES